MPDSPRRLNEADASFVAMSAATGATFAPLTVSVYERGFDGPETTEYLNEVMARHVPAMRQRITKDRLSLALPRWSDVPGFDPSDHIVVLPAPGDGTLRPILDWAQRWGRLPLPVDRPPWRAAYFEDVTVDGVGGRLVLVSQFHHAVIDGQGATRLAERFIQWGPEGDLPEMPPLGEPDAATRWEHWRAGWALEGAKAKELTRNAARRLRGAAADPSAGAARAKAVGRALGRLQAHQGTTTMSPILTRRSDRNRFDHLAVDLDALRAGARAVGGSANDGLLAAFSVGLQRWHVDLGVKPRELRTAMPINTRAAEASHAGNELIAVMLALPLLDDAAEAVKSCGAVSRAHRDDQDVLWLLDRFRAAGNRLPKSVIARLWGPSVKAIDLSISNVKGMPLRNWVAGVEVLDTIPFIVGGPAIAATLLSGPNGATLGVVTDPECVADPAHLMARLAEGIAEVAALAQK
jgi:diacylglycerol O-acyltransferase